MTKSEIVQYVKDSFLPITLATPDSVIQKNVERSLAWFDRAGCDVRLRQYPYGGERIKTLDDDVDMVLEVWTDRVVTELFTAQTLLLGVTILDYDIETLSLKQIHLQNLRQFLASKFRWRWEKPTLYMTGQTINTTAIVVQYLRYYDWTLDTDDIVGKPLAWIIENATARTKITEGTIIRKAAIVGAQMDGPELAIEGRQELADVEQKLVQTRQVLGLFRG